MKNKHVRKLKTVGFVLTLFFVIVGVNSAKEPQKSEHLRGYSKRVTPTDCGMIKDSLSVNSDEKFISAAKLYYSDNAAAPATKMFDNALPKWVVYLRKDAAGERILYKAPDSSDLTGERFVWVVVFTDIDVSTGNNSLALSMLRIDDSAGPAEKMLGAIGKMFSFSASRSVPDSAVKSDEDSFKDYRSSITLHNVVSPGDPECRLAAGSARMDLRANSLARLVISPIGESRDTLLEGTEVRSVMREVTVGDRSYLGASIAGGIVFNHEKQKKISMSPNLYLFANIYLFPYSDSRPRFNKYAPSWTIGTNLAKGSLLDEIVVGITFGHLIGSGGVVIGDAFSHLDEKLKQRLFFGLNMSL